MSPSTRLLASFVFSVLAASLLLILPAIAEADLPTNLTKAHFDWVCVTDAGLVEAYAPLADHRRGQGLACLIVPLDEAILWSPAADDTTATLRWLAGVAHRQWGARYLLLGGSHALLPAPLHRLEFSWGVFEYPTDAYYACLDGDWDVNDNGFVAEWEVDAADPTVHLALGGAECLPQPGAPGVRELARCRHGAAAGYARRDALPGAGSGAGHSRPVESLGFAR